MTVEEILATEFSKDFVTKMRGAMVESFYKYGPLKSNYSIDKCLHAKEALKKNIDKFERDPNQDYLVNIANFAMILYMCPGKEDYYRHSSDRSVVGMGVAEIARIAAESVD